MTESLLIPGEDTSLRQLSNAEFEARYDCDRLTASVISNRCRYIVQHMCNGILSTAFSIILRDWYDFAACLVGPKSQGYPMPSVSNSLVMFLGTMDVAVQNSVEEFGSENLRPGDVLIGNDPYRIGNHINDLCLIRPVFEQSLDEPIAFVTLRAHMLDMGGSVPTGFSGTKKNTYENGLVLSPRLLYRDDSPVKETYNLIFDNARFGGLLLSDLMTINQNLSLGQELLLSTVDRYGVGAYLGAVRYACDLGAETMRTAIEKLPDGDYVGEDYLDADGVDESEEYRVRAKVRIRGGRAEVDFSGTSRQARTSVNAAWPDLRTATAVAMKFLIDSKSPFTSGSLRDVDIVLPDGTLVSALPPEGVIFIYAEATGVVVSAIFKALEGALGADAIGGDFGTLSIHSAQGVGEDGTPWVTMAQCGGEHGPWSATSAGDGESYMVCYQANNIDPATEAIEADIPVVLLRKEYVCDSAGAGAHRGGAGVLKDSLWLADADHYSIPLRMKRPPGFGVNGGSDGAAGAAWLWESGDSPDGDPMLATSADAYSSSTPIAGRLETGSKTIDPDGEYFYFAREAVWRPGQRARFRYVTAGAGGWGSPFDRDPDLVLRDVRDGYVSIESAAASYGVAVVGDPEWDPEGLAVDEARTSELRASRPEPDAAPRVNE